MALQSVPHFLDEKHMKNNWTICFFAFIIITFLTLLAKQF